MKRTALTLTVFLLLVLPLFAQNVDIPDEAFFQALLERGADRNRDSLISVEEAKTVTYLHVGNKGIWDMTGIEEFINLERLTCADNALKSLDVSSCTKLRELSCSGNNLSSLKVTGCSVLEELNCYNNQITKLDVSACTSLTELNCDMNALDYLDVSGCSDLIELSCDDNQLSSLDISKNNNLKYLSCSENQITHLNVSNCTSLEGLTCSKNQLTSLDVSNNTALRYLGCSDNQLDSLDVSNSNALESLSCQNNRLTNLNASACTVLQELHCQDNQLGNLNVTGCTSLTLLDGHNNQLVSVDFTDCRLLKQLNCGNNKLVSLDLSNNFALKEIELYLNPSLHVVCVWTPHLPLVGVEFNTAGSPNVQFTTDTIYLDHILFPDEALFEALIDQGIDLNGDNLISYAEAEAVHKLDLENKGITSLRGIGFFTSLDTLDCSGNGISHLNLLNNKAIKQLDCSDNSSLKEVCIWELPIPFEVDSSLSPHIFFTTPIHIPDVNFLKGLIANKVDHNQDGWISHAEGESTNFVNVYHRDITDMTGINAFVNLDSLICGENFFLNYLNVSHCKSLQYLHCGQYHGYGSSAGEPRFTLDISSCTALNTLICNGSRLDQLDVSNNMDLTELNCAGNNLTNLDISKNTKLTILNCAGNNLTNLDISKNTQLTILNCADNRLTGLDVSKNVSLIHLNCAYNKLKELDVSNNVALIHLNCAYGELTELDVSRCTALEFLDCSFYGSWLLEEVGTLTSLNVTGCVFLRELNCRGHQLSHLDVSENPALIFLDCEENQLSSLDVAHNTNLIFLNCSFNELHSLDVTNNAFLELLLCSGNQLNTLDVSNNTSLGGWDGFSNSLYISNMPSLSEVCVWAFDYPIPPFPKSRVDTSDSPNVIFTTSCHASKIPVLEVLDTLINEEHMYVSCSKDAVLYLVHEHTYRDLAVIRNFSIDSFSIMAQNVMELPVSDLGSGVYWLYAKDSSENISQPEAFTIIGVGITPAEFENIRIYPNPTRHYISIETGTFSPCRIHITSLNGQQIFSREMEGSTHQIDLSSFKRGIYIITIRSRDFVTTRKLIKL